MIKNNVYILLPFLGGVLIILSIFLPWVIFFGGLQTYSGINGLNGQILLAAGIVTIFLCRYLYAHPTAKTQVIIGIVGFLELGFTSFLLLNVWQVLQAAQSTTVNTMMVEGIGPGLFVTLVGSLLVFSVLFFHVRHISVQRAS